MIDWGKTAFLFPGQGSQLVGMGQDFVAAYPAALAVFEQAELWLGFNLRDICFHGPETALNDTSNTQPALYTHSAAILRVLRDELPQARPAYVAGHSMGELTALFAAGAMTFEDGLTLVRARGKAMKAAGEKSPGAMAAVLGLESPVVQEICATATVQVGRPVVLANDNCPGQVVISGDNQALDLAMQAATEKGAKRVVKLPISIASHSPLMAAAAADFGKAVDATPFQTPQIPVYANITAAPLTAVADIRPELKGQLTQPVRWTESMQALIAAGVTTFIEIGSGEVLSGLIKRIGRDQVRVTLNSVAALQVFVAANR